MNINVTDYARSFITEYNVKKLDRQTLEAIIDKLGYKIIQFNKLANEDSVELLIESLSLENDVKQKQCFTYSNPAFRRIFICDNINESDSIQALLHEIGHIYMRHKIDSEADTLHIENEANEFVYAVLNQIKKRRIKKYTAFTFLGVLVCAGVITATISGLISLSKNNNALTQNSSAIDSSVVITTTTALETSARTTTLASTTTATTSKKIAVENNEEEIYYITKTGTKYHLANCYHIAGRTVMSDTKEELERMGYQPCAVCIGG